MGGLLRRMRELLCEADDVVLNKVNVRDVTQCSQRERQRLSV